MIKEQGAEDSEQTSSGPRVRALISSRDNLARITAEVAARRRTRNTLSAHWSTSSLRAGSGAPTTLPPQRQSGETFIVAEP